MHVPNEAELLRAYLKKTDESWKTLAISGRMKTKQPVFFYDGSLWRYSKSGIVFGYVIGRELELVMVGATTQ